jgi:hypothetical protein
LSGVVVTSASNVTTPGKADVMQTSFYCADAGSNDTYACNLSPAVTAYVTGTTYRFKANTANTGTASVNFNTVGALTIVKTMGGITTVLDNGDILAGQWVSCTYDGTNCQMQTPFASTVTGVGGAINRIAVWGNTAATILTSNGIWTNASDQTAIIGNDPAALTGHTAQNSSTSGFAGFEGIHPSGSGTGNDFFGWVGSTHATTAFRNSTLIWQTGGSGVIISGDKTAIGLGVTSGNLVGAATLDTSTATAAAYNTATLNGVTINTLALLTSLRSFKMSITPLVGYHTGKLRFGIGDPSNPLGGPIEYVSTVRGSMLKEAMLLKPISYTSKTCRPGGITWAHGCREIGLIAEDVKLVDPRLTTDKPDGSLLGVQYDRTGVIAIAAIQELKAIVDKLTAEVEAQRKEIERLKVKK